MDGTCSQTLAVSKQAECADKVNPEDSSGSSDTLGFKMRRRYRKEESWRLGFRKDVEDAMGRMLTKMGLDQRPPPFHSHTQSLPETAQQGGTASVEEFVDGLLGSVDDITVSIVGSTNCRNSTSLISLLIVLDLKSFQYTCSLGPYVVPSIG